MPKPSLARLVAKTLHARWDTIRYDLAKRRRAARYAPSGLEFAPHPETMEALEQDGYAVVRGAFTPERLLRLGDELQSALNSGQLLTVLRNPAAPGPGKTLTEEELARGEAYIAQHANYAAIRDPLVTCPAAVPHVYSETVIDMAAGYLGCPPALSGLNLRKSFVNDLPEMETNLFHCDGNSPMFIKFFLYLNDVDEPGGPFCYIAGSHRRKPLAWRRKYHWSAKEIEAYYGNGAVRTLTGRVGRSTCRGHSRFPSRLQGAKPAALHADHQLRPPPGFLVRPTRRAAACLLSRGLYREATRGERLRCVGLVSHRPTIMRAIRLTSLRSSALKMAA